MIRVTNEVSIELPKFPSLSNLGIFSQIIIYATFNICSMHICVSLVAQMVKNLPAVWETWIWSLGWEDAREKKMQPTPVFWPGEVHGLYSPWVTKSQTQLSDFHLPVFLPGEFHGQRSQSGYSPWGRTVRHDWATNTYAYINILNQSLTMFNIYLSSKFFYSQNDHQITVHLY